ncbi:MAG: ThuA domain-containing protein [Clostridia bacterium]|nr:ThuA domain-containing protein [Clostridia bacterium]
MIKVTVWNEGVHEKFSREVSSVYPDGIHGCIRDFLGINDDIQVRTATLGMKECGLPDSVLNDTDVLIWWGHMAHGRVPDKLVDKIYDRVLRGMGLIVLHSGHHSKIFKKLMGTTCNLSWREGDRERLWTVNPAHPIAQGVDPCFDLDVEEMYGERFDIPEPDQLIFLGWFAGGEVFRSGCCWQKGLGRIFYFQPGHESNPTYHNENVQKIITNAVRWVYPSNGIAEKLECPHIKVSPEQTYKEQHNG